MDFDMILRVLSPAIALTSLFYTIILTYKTKRIREQVERVQLDVLKASELYMYVKNVKKVYGAAMTNLIVACTNESAIMDGIKKIF